MINIKEGEQSGSKIRSIFLKPTAQATGPSMRVRDGKHEEAGCGEKLVVISLTDVLVNHLLIIRFCLS